VARIRSRAAGTALAVVLAATAAVVVVAVAAASPASAHGVLRASDPADRAVLDQAPTAVSLSFTEAPEPRLSSVQVLDASGASFGEGELQPVAGDSETIRMGLRPLPRGVYTVSGRIVSRVDGHLTAGTFAFGVQEPVTSSSGPAGATPVGTPSNRTPGAVGGRVLLYAGLALLLGAAWTGLTLFGGDRRKAVLVLAGAGLAGAAAGIVVLGLAQRASTGVSLGVFLQTRLGRSLLWRAAGVVAAAAGLVVARGGGRRRWRAGMGLVAVGTIAIIVAHVESGHAAAGSWPWAMVALQVVHVTAMAVWIGGLVALLVGLRSESEADGGAAAARRFSAVAGVALGALVVTGVVRALDAVGGWSALWNSDYGRLVALKSGLLLVLATLGGINRFRHVPGAGDSLAGRPLARLRRVGTTEVAVAAGVLVITGLLTTSAPPATARTEAPEVVLTASDFGTTLKARLAVSPAQPGENRFTLRLADYDTGEPAAADRVTARFVLPAFPGSGPSSLELPPTGTGTFAASGTNLSLPGRWRVILVIERGAGSLELPMELVTRTPPPAVTVARAPGQPTISTATVAGGRSMQVYVDPERPGPAELHVTFFTAAGSEEPMGSVVVTAAGTDTATPRRLGPGHFVADVDVPSGRWPVAVTAVTAAGDYLYAPLELEIAP
jgi:copper transport protein